MISGHSVLAIIPARGGSKGLPRKNILPLMEKPLIVWTIEAARSSSLIDRVVLSSEDREIIDIGRQWGCDVPFPRPAELASDTARTIEVLHHLLKNIDQHYDFVVQLQPTSPFRNADDIDGALEFCLQKCSPACVSVSPARKSPQWIFSRSDSGRMVPILPMTKGVSRRQDEASYFELNGAIYIAQSEWIVERDSFLSDETVGYVMTSEHSLDIDTKDDFLIAEMYASRVKCNNN